MSESVGYLSKHVLLIVQILMQSQEYNWQRFWCPTTGKINFDFSGFLYNPESQSGSTYNPDVIKFDAISDIPCLILLGEAGIGKTTATEQEYKKVEHQLRQSEDGFCCKNLR